MFTKDVGDEIGKRKVSATSVFLQVVRLTEYLHRGESKDGLLHHGFVGKNTIRDHHGFVDNEVEKSFQNALPRLTTGSTTGLVTSPAVSGREAMGE